MGKYKLSGRSRQRMRGVDPRLIEVAELAIQITVVDFGIPEHGGKRTTPEQKGLFDAGLSKCDGTRNPSNHQDGKALDFYAYVDRAGSWGIEHLALVACAFLQAASMLGYKLKWGGLWGGGPYVKGFTDMPHMELIDG